MSKQDDTNAIRIVDANGAELKPTKNYKKVRKLLQSGRARIESYQPFTIRLLYEVLDIESPVTPAKEVLKVNNQTEKLSETKNFVIGTNGEESVLTTGTNQNILSIGSKSAGKTDSFIIPMIMRCAKNGFSMVVTDAYGGIYEELSPYLRENGYDVRQYSFPEDAKGNFANLICSGSELNTRTLIQKRANSILDEFGDSFDIVYRSGASALLQALILRVAYSKEVPVEKKTLLTVQEVLAKPDILAYLDKLFDANEHKTDKVAGEMPYRAFRCASDNLCRTIIGQLLYNLDLYILGHEELTGLHVDPLPDKVALFVSTVPTTSVYAKLVKDAIAQIGKELFAKADASDGMKLSNPCFVIIDDAPDALGKLTGDVMGIINKANARSIFFGLSIQGVPQLRRVYGEKGPEKLEKISRVFSTILHFADPVDYETEMYLAKLYNSPSEKADRCASRLPRGGGGMIHCFSRAEKEGVWSHTYAEVISYELLPEYEEIKHSFENTAQ